MRLSPEATRYYRRVDEIEKLKPTSTNRIVRYFPNTHMGNGHQGLSEIASKHKINIRKLDPGEFVIFVNHSQTALKMFAPGNVIAHLKMPGTNRINAKVISMIPKFFNGTQIEYDKALREIIQKEFGH